MLPLPAAAVLSPPRRFRILVALLLQYQHLSLPKFSAYFQPKNGIVSDVKVYSSITKQLSKHLDSMLPGVLRVGQVQLFRRAIAQELQFSCRLDSNLLYSSLRTFNNAVVTDIRRHYHRCGSMAVIVCCPPSPLHPLSLLSFPALPALCRQFRAICVPRGAKPFAARAKQSEWLLWPGVFGLPHLKDFPFPVAGASALTFRSMWKPQASRTP